MSRKAQTTPFDPPASKGTKRNLRMTDIQSTGTKRTHKGVQNFADFAGEQTHRRFDEMLDQTIYIVKLETMTSDTYGAGFKVYYKDIPGEKATYDCSVFGKYPVEQLANLYTMTLDGSRISLDSPVRTVIRAAGKSYKFE